MKPWLIEYRRRSLLSYIGVKLGWYSENGQCANVGWFSGPLHIGGAISSRACALNYLYNLVVDVDTAHGVISHVQADLVDRRDRVHLPQLVTHQRLLAQGLSLLDQIADTNYPNGVNYALLK